MRAGTEEKARHLNFLGNHSGLSAESLSRALGFTCG